MRQSFKLSAYINSFTAEGQKHFTDSKCLSTLNVCVIPRFFVDCCAKMISFPSYFVIFFVPLKCNFSNSINGEHAYFYMGIGGVPGAVVVISALHPLAKPKALCSNRVKQAWMRTYLLVFRLSDKMARDDLK